MEQIVHQQKTQFDISHNQLANAIRFLSMDAVEKAKSGHPGMPMGMADVATVLWQKFLKFNPKEPNWPDRDRFVLSAGHGSMLLYSLLYLTGYPQMTLDQLRHFRQLGSATAGHPEYGHTPGIETTTGPLGQGVATSVGMALAEKMLKAEYGSDLVNHYTYVIASDGDLMEGISHEAISLAGHLKLNKLIIFFDDNSISIDGSTSLSVSDDQIMRFQACGWSAYRIDGHNPEAIEQAIRQAHQSEKPTLIACRTTIAYGAPTKAGTAHAHGSPLGAQEIEETRKNLDWSYPAFEIPESILKTWRMAAEYGKDQHHQWQERFSQLDQRKARDFERRYKGGLPKNWQKPLEDLKKKWEEIPPALATRQLSQQVLDVLASAVPEMVGGSADLTGSNNTKAQGQKIVSPQDYFGRYIHYGIREHAMAAVMNGLSLHGGFIPYGGTFLIFSDYLRPSLRLSALMKKRVIYVLTHDSIGLGEDGPTHQPIEQLAALRAIPNVNVFRPADAIEVAECWEKALMEESTPSIIALTRQNILPVRQQKSSENLSSLGGYILRESNKNRQVTLMATGSEVGLAVQAQEMLEQKGIAAAVISIPCWRLFDQQPAAYRQTVLGSKDSLRVSIEAASSFGWERYVGTTGLIFGIDTFGASAPYQHLYQKFGLTPEVITKKIELTLKSEKMK